MTDFRNTDKRKGRPLKITPQPLIFYPGKACRILIGISIFLLLAHIAAMFSTYALEKDHLLGLVPLFDFDMEKNVPTLFSVCLLLVNSALFAAVWNAGRRNKMSSGSWLFLCAVFLFLSIDELSSVHEHLSVALNLTFHATGFFYFVWVVPYGIAVLLIAATVMPTIWRLSKQIRFWFVLSAVVYVSGALGLEMVGGKYFETSNTTFDMVYVTITTIEESMEIAGLIILVYALLTLLQHEYGGFALVMPEDREFQHYHHLEKNPSEANGWSFDIDKKGENHSASIKDMDYGQRLCAHHTGQE